MKLFRRSYAPDPDQRVGIFEDLEVLLRRLRAVGLAAPLLLVVGFGVGNAGTDHLESAEGAVRTAALDAPAPRVHLELLSRHMERLQDTGARGGPLPGPVGHGQRRRAAALPRPRRARQAPEEVLLVTSEPSLSR